MFLDKIKNNSKKDNLGIFLFALGIIFLLITTYIGFSKIGLWFDEIYSLNLVSQPFSQMIDSVLNDVHPMLYYLILKVFEKLFSSFADAAVIARLVSVIPIYLIVILSFTKVRKFFGWLTAGLFVLCITSMPQLMLYSVEVRMYSWGLFFVTASLIYAYDIFYKNNFNLKNLAILTVLTICSAYTHYFSAIASFAIYLCLFVYLFKNKNSNLKYLIVSGVISVLAFVPWVFVVLNQYSLVQNNYWIDPISLNSIINYIYFILSPADMFIRGNELLSPNILGTVFLIIFVFLIYKARDKFAITSILIFLTVPIIGILISVIFQPFFHERYMIPALGCLWLGFSILLSKIYDNKKLFIPILIFVLLISAIGCITFIDIETQYAISTQNEYSQINEIIGSGNIVCIDSHIINTELEGYFSNDNHYLGWSENFADNLCQALEDPGIKAEIDSGAHVFYIDYGEENIDEFEPYNLTMVLKGTFNDFCYENTTFRIYEIVL